MKNPINVDFEDLEWQPHPTIPGIEIKLFQNTSDFSPVDVMIARVAQHGEIPWHVHETNTEITYVLQGSGILYGAEDEKHEVVSATPMDAGGTVVVPPGLWHSVENTGDGDLLIFASHTP
ncbi:MAG: cupin domain-containing protein [Anaerolineae bacterium]|nr:cupin domain-containing protein [Anaerolineae bacterium]